MLSDLLKTVLDQKLWGTAEKVKELFHGQKFRVEEMKSVNPAKGIRSHLVCKKSYKTIAIDIREKCTVDRHIEEYIKDCHTRRIPVEFYFAVPSILKNKEGIEEPNSITITQREFMKELGIGLLILDEKQKIIKDLGTVSCDRRFALPPGTSLGTHKTKIADLIEKYNSGDCLDAVRDLCEEGEDATVMLAIKAAKKGKIVFTEVDIKANLYDWETLINCLSAPSWGATPQIRIITDKKITNSLKSFKDKRNLSDHRKTAIQLRDLEALYPEAMLEGIRLIRKLIQLRNSI
jgi:hypothetical protein